MCDKDSANEWKTSSLLECVAYLIKITALNAAYSATKIIK